MNLKIFTTLKFRVTFYSVRMFETSSPGDSTSSNRERTALRRGGEEPGYVEVFSRGQVILTSKDGCELKKN